MSNIIYYIGAGASYGKKEAREVIEKDTVKEKLLIHEGLPVINEIIQLIEYYGNLSSDTSNFSFQFTSRLSYAWETSERQRQMFEMLQKMTYDTTTVVVIGYSFPYFNRQIDRKIFAAMPSLKTVCIQDPNPEAIEPSLRAVLLNESATKIVYQKDCTQFYLPREL